MNTEQIFSGDLRANKGKNSRPCYINGRKYRSLFSAAIDCELNYSWLIMKLKKNKYAPIKINKIEIILEDWVKKHPEYNYKPATPEGRKV
jgi:hypothetical protein